MYAAMLYIHFQVREISNRQLRRKGRKINLQTLTPQTRHKMRANPSNHKLTLGPPQVLPWYQNDGLQTYVAS